MERLLTPADIAARYTVTERTARRYMARMPHQTEPLRVSEADLARWEMNRTIDPEAAPQAHYKAPRRARIIGDRIPRRKE